MYQLGIERAGIPTVTIVTNSFMGLARSTMKSEGASSLAFVEIQHPVGGIGKEEVEAKAKAILDEVIQKAISWKSEGDLSTAKESYYPAKTVKIRGAYEDINDFYFRQKWTDGFPVIPPTKERVEAMLAGTSLPPDRMIMKIPPREAGLTVEGIAINGVMAGCRPEYMPILVSAFELLAEETHKGWDLRQPQVTTNPVSIALVVSGPIAKEIGVHSGGGLLGPGYHANATIGRAFQTILRNVGGAHSPSPNQATHGQSGEFSMCIAENDDNPWGPLRTQLGFGKEESVVILFPMFQRRNVNDHWNTTGKGILTTIAHEMAVVESPLLRDAMLLIILGPEHASTVSKDKWDLKNIRRFLYEWGRVPFSRFIPGGGGWPSVPKWIAEAPEATCMVPVVNRPEDILVGVAGGAGKHSMIFVGGYGEAIGGLIKK
ncbi:MAG: hypothetical protein ACE144_06650 [Thermodesulfobacteriota bacterium]